MAKITLPKKTPRKPKTEVVENETQLTEALTELSEIQGYSDTANPLAKDTTTVEAPVEPVVEEYAESNTDVATEANIAQNALQSLVGVSPEPMIVSEAVFDQITEALENPPEPSQKLLDALDLIPTTTIEEEVAVESFNYGNQYRILTSGEESSQIYIEHPDPHRLFDRILLAGSLGAVLPEGYVPVFWANIKQVVLDIPTSALKALSEALQSDLQPVGQRVEDSASVVYNHPDPRVFVENLLEFAKLGAKTEAGHIHRYFSNTAFAYLVMSVDKAPAPSHNVAVFS